MPNRQPNNPNQFLKNLLLFYNFLFDYLPILHNNTTVVAMEKFLIKFLPFLLKHQIVVSLDILEAIINWFLIHLDLILNAFHNNELLCPITFCYDRIYRFLLLLELLCHYQNKKLLCLNLYQIEVCL